MISIPRDRSEFVVLEDGSVIVREGWQEAIGEVEPGRRASSSGEPPVETRSEGGPGSGNDGMKPKAEESRGTT